MIFSSLKEVTFIELSALSGTILRKIDTDLYLLNIIVNAADFQYNQEPFILIFI